MEYNRKPLPFLNITVINKEGNIETVIYFKKTESQQYLSDIAHPALSTATTVTAKVALDTRYMQEMLACLHRQATLNHHLSVYF